MFLLIHGVKFMTLAWFRYVRNVRICRMGLGWG